MTVYTLWSFNITIWKITIFNGKIHDKLAMFNSKLLNYQRVSLKSTRHLPSHGTFGSQQSPFCGCLRPISWEIGWENSWCKSNGWSWYNFVILCVISNSISWHVMYIILSDILFYILCNCTCNHHWTCLSYRRTMVLTCQGLDLRPRLSWRCHLAQNLAQNVSELFFFFLTLKLPKII